jgi:hypothetical protein
LAVASLLLPSCESGGHFTLLGYTTRPNYDPNIHTVRLKIFKNVTFYRGLEFELAEALKTEIEAKTPFKVVGGDCDADTELSGTIGNYSKNVINRNQLNEVREAQTVLAVDVVWRDLRTGEILSRPVTGGPPAMPIILPEPATGPVAVPLAPADVLLPNAEAAANTPPGAALPGAASPGPIVPGGFAPPAPPVLIQSTASFIPELGGSITTARQKNVNSLATQIVSMMEVPW